MKTKLLYFILLVLAIPTAIALADTWYPTSGTLTPASPSFGSIKLTGTATSTATKGFDIAAGCYAINGTCISSGGGGVTSVTGTYPVISSGGSTPAISLAFGTTTANSWSQLQQFNGNATTSQITSTNSAYLATTGGLVGIGTTLPAANLDVYQTAGQASFIARNTIGNGTLIQASDIAQTSGVGLGYNIAPTGGVSVNVGYGGSSANTIFRSTNTNGNDTSAVILDLVAGNSGQSGNYLQTKTSTGSLLDVITSSGSLGIATSSPKWPVSVASPSTPQLALLGKDTDNIWTMRGIGNTFYIATASPTTYSTSTSAALTIDTNGKVTANCFTNDGTTCITSGGGSSDPFTHPATGQSATTSLMLFNGNATTTQITSTNAAYLATAGGNVGIGTSTPFALLTVNPSSFPLPATGLFSLGTSTIVSGSANGTYMAINTPASFSGNYFDIQKGGSSVFKVDSSGSITSTAGTQILGTNVSLQSNTGSGISVKGSFQGTSQDGIVDINDVFSPNNTSGSMVHLTIHAGGSGFTPTSGTGTYIAFSPEETINQTGNSSGITRSIYINPTLTRAYDHRDLETSGGTYNMTFSTTTLQSVLFNAPKFASTTATTLSFGNTQTISGAPIASTNVTISTSTALTIQGGAVNGGGTVNGAFGLMITAPTGASNNYAATTTGRWIMNGLSAFASGDSALCIRGTGELTVDSGVSSCIVSSRKAKHDILSVSTGDSLNRILSLNPVSFIYNESNQHDLGLIAEDVAKIDPRYAQYAGTDRTLSNGEIIKKGDPSAINWAAITADLIKGFQSLVARVSGLENRLNDQQKQLDKQEQEIKELRALIKK